MSSRTPVRKPHKKSRFGCQECKRRHVKCNEARPTCAHCSTTSKVCVYRSPPSRTSRSSSVPATRRLSPPAAPTRTGARSATTAPSPASVGLHPSTPSNFGASIDSPNTAATHSAQHGVLHPPLNMRHMELYSNFIFNTAPSLDEDNPPDRAQLQIMMPAMLSVPYVMYQILALSALHMSHTNPSKADYHREEATTLQIQALALFNESGSEVTAENCAPMLVFSSFLGLHTLAEAVMASRTDGIGLLDRFVTYLDLHRGVRVVTGQAWKFLTQSSISSVIHSAERAMTAAPSQQSQKQAAIVADRLNRLLDDADMGANSEEACRDAVSWLKLVYQCELLPRQMPREEPATSVIWAWPVMLSAVFTRLLMERRPEALIILCYYAVLLHQRRQVWIVGDGGRVLIEEMTRFLGTYWKDYLEWPNEMLEDSF